MVFDRPWGIEKLDHVSGHFGEDGVGEDGVGEDGVGEDGVNRLRSIVPSKPWGKAIASN